MSSQHCRRNESFHSVSAAARPSKRLTKVWSHVHSGPPSSQHEGVEGKACVPVRLTNSVRRKKLAIKSVLAALIPLMFLGNLLQADEPEPVDFERHVAPLLGRLGCNSAACHGAFGGKGDLQLSLFGYSAEMDFDALLSKSDSDHPDESLLLRKPSGDAKHEGGIKFSKDSEEYRVLRQWIVEDNPWKEGSGIVERLIATPSILTFNNFSSEVTSEPFPLKVTAHFADGTSEDVTHLSQFSSRDEGLVKVTAEGNVIPHRQGSASLIVSYSNQYTSVNTIIPFAPAAKPSLYESYNQVDEFINLSLQRLNMPASEISQDEEFLRRLTLDTIGRIPTPDEITRFCSDSDPAKREKKIDALLSDPMHAALWANRMCEITKSKVTDVSEDRLLETKRAQWWHAWFRKRFQDNTPYDQIARDIITATSRGETETKRWLKQEAELVREPLNSWKTKYTDRQGLDLYWQRTGPNGAGFPVEDMAELTASAFTGVRINCARCHKHPFDRWSQDDYASFANIFSEVVYGSSPELNTAIFDELDQRRDAKKRGETPDTLPQIQEVYNSREWGKRVIGSSADVDVSPKPLGGDRLVESSNYRVQFARWLTEKDNPFFAKNFANRVWSVYFGIGIVNPVDDFSIGNPASHPELLDMLADQFKDSDFDVRNLEKSILMSAAYQRSSTPVKLNERDTRNFARQYVRPLLSEMILDSLNVALGCDEQFPGLPTGTLAIELGGDQVGGPADSILKTFGKGERESVCDCDRQIEPDLNQSIFLMVDDFILKKIKHGNIQQLLEQENKPLLNQLYLRLLGRSPNQTEVDIGLDHFETHGNREQAFNDLVWALVNTREFITNH